MRVWRLKYDGTVISLHDTRTEAEDEARRLAGGIKTALKGFRVQSFSMNGKAGPERVIK